MVLALRLGRRHPIVSQQHPKFAKGVSLPQHSSAIPLTGSWTIWVAWRATLSTYTVTDLDNADDIALPASVARPWDVPVGILNGRPDYGLKCGLAEDEGAVFDPGGTSSDVIIEGNPVESVKSFCYVGSVQDSSGRCSPDILRRIGIAPSSMGSLSRIWRQRGCPYVQNSEFIWRTSF